MRGKEFIRRVAGQHHLLQANHAVHTMATFRLELAKSGCWEPFPETIVFPHCMSPGTGAEALRRAWSKATEEAQG